MSMTPVGSGRSLALRDLRSSPRELVGRGPSAAATLTGALMALVLYAAFAGGAANLAGQARIQVVVALITAVCAGAVLWTRTLRFAAPRGAVVGLCLLGGFAAWNAISLGWSIAPDATWTDFNRALTYVIVLGLSIVVGASSRRSLALVARGYVAVVLLVAAYAIGQKLVPGLHVGGLINLNHPESLPRLEEPLGYWNALGAFLAMGAPVMLALAVSPTGSRRLRITCVLGLQVVLLTIGLTYSRGALLALVPGLAAAIALNRARLRSLLWLAVAAVAAVPALVAAVRDPDLNGFGVPLSTREGAGVVLALVLIASMLALRAVATRLIAAEQRIALTPERARRIGRRLVLLAAALAAIAVIAVAVSPRGLTGTVSHAWHGFTATKGTSTYAPNRLLSVDSENRWVWWKEAAGAWSDRPLTGWGAGSFSTIQPLYTRTYIPVKEPHNVPLQFLVEVGLIGAGLALAGFALLLGAGFRAARRSADPQRAVPAALFGAVVIYAIHTLYDWDWDIPGVTLPALVCLGVLIGSRYAGRITQTYPSGDGSGLRIGALALATLACCAVATSGVVPSLAASNASKALVLAASASSPSTMAEAESKAMFASSLDPLSNAGLIVQAQIAVRAHRLLDARSDLLAAIRRDPEDVVPWARLFDVESMLHDYGAVLAVSRRALELFPTALFPRFLIRQAMLLLAPPNATATSIQTPLPGG